MIDDALVLATERLRDELGEFRGELRRRYKSPDAQVRAQDVKRWAARIAETWMVELAQRNEVVAALSSDYLADLTIHFQRILTFSERACIRSRYDAEISAITKNFTNDVVIPLKQLKHRTTDEGPKATLATSFSPTAFVGHSFAAADREVVDAVVAALTALRIDVVTGEKPKADKISEKVKRLIEGQYMFVGIFTRGERIQGSSRWTTSAWVIDEKAYALAKGKRLILLREEDVDSIGGIQGDYEFIEFSRSRMSKAVVALLEIFDLSVAGLR